MPPHERALKLAAQTLRVSRSDFWRDDLLQAARVRLWQRAPATTGLAYAVAVGAMRDELRRVTDARTQGCTIPGAIDWAMCGAHTDTPEATLQAAQTLDALRAALPGWPDALAECDTLADAGERMGVTESRACQRRGELARALG